MYFKFLIWLVFILDFLGSLDELKQFDTYMLALNSWCNEQQQSSVQQIPVWGQPVCVKHRDTSQWRRAQVTRLSNEYAMIFYLLPLYKLYKTFTRQLNITVSIFFFFFVKNFKRRSHKHGYVPTSYSVNPARKFWESVQKFQKLFSKFVNYSRTQKTSFLTYRVLICSETQKKTSCVLDQMCKTRVVWEVHVGYSEHPSFPLPTIKYVYSHTVYSRIP